MLDPRITQLSEQLVHYSTSLGPKDKLLIHAFDIPNEATAELVRVAQATGAEVMTRIESSLIRRQLQSNMSESNAKLITEIEMHEMKHMTAYIAIRGTHNFAETSDVPTEKLDLWQKNYSNVQHHRVNNTKWVVLRWPTPSMAQQASMSTPAFEKFFFDVCNLDYSKVAKACKPLETLMNKTDQVHITGPGTDLRFSIKGIGSQPCIGDRNIPDGECYSCPVKDSVEGVVQYNTVTLYQGLEFSNIRFVVKKGKIIEATADHNIEQLNRILDTDEGARYFGEWSLGFNPYILHPMKDILFDEKIAGSFHLTPGQAYEEAGNGNQSSVHWDLVCIQRPEYGGGEIWFDGKLIRKDGLFVLPELEGLNPDHFIKNL